MHGAVEVESGVRAGADVHAGRRGRRRRRILDVVEQRPQALRTHNRVGNLASIPYQRSYHETQKRSAYRGIPLTLVLNKIGFSVSW